MIEFRVVEWKEEEIFERALWAFINGSRGRRLR